MFCPTCGFEERQLIQYCRACGTDLRVVRVSLQDREANSTSAFSARDHISRAIAEKIRETQSAKDLQKVATEVLPEIEKFLETPEEKRLRRIRAGVVFASIGLGASLIFTALSSAEPDFLFFIGVGVIFFVLGLGIILNGLLFTKPRKTFSEPLEALEQKQLEMQAQTLLRPNIPNTNELDARSSLQSSVTEHTTHHLKPNS
ncbi:MAG TPA: hypothetical protein VIT88_11935 [Pyrinomonadaceae bacterium]